MRPWLITEARVLRSGMTAAQIAAHIGRSRVAVSQFARSNGIILPRKRARIAPAMKACTGPCGSWLSPSGFYADARNADGLSGACKECTRARARESSRRSYVPTGGLRQPRSYDGKFARAA